jgi:hypothetical protein
LRDTQYAIGGQVSGMGMKALACKHDLQARAEFEAQTRERKGVLQKLLTASQLYIYSREAVLVISQFIVVFMALGLRDRLGLSAGDFARIVGYTTQVAAAFVGAASTLDSVISFSRAYHVYVTGGRLR